MADSKKYDGSQWEHSLRKLTTATDTLTTLPADVYADGNNATVSVSGNTVQNGTPSPDNPIMPQDTGERTGNLFDYQTMLSGVAGHYLSAEGSEIINDYWAITKYIPVDGTTFTLSRTFGGGSPSICLYDVDKHYITGVSYNNNQITTISDSRAKYARFSYFVGYEGQPAENVANDMLVKGSTAPSSYIPYGYKIPISSASTTTPVYLGEVESTRQIKKLVLTGEENCYLYSVQSTKGIEMINMLDVNYQRTNGICSHYPVATTSSANSLWIGVNNKTLYFVGILDDLGLSSSTAFKQWLATQYANGTPVTVWYVLATPETAVVNEPLRKIGNYADTVSGITIPTITGKDTFDVETTLKPSEVSLSYTGWHDSSVKEWDGSDWQ